MSCDRFETEARRGWLLVGLALVFVVVFAGFVYTSNTPGMEPTWDMNGTPFVPASSNEATGYDLPGPDEVRK